MEGLARIICAHPLFAGVHEDFCTLVCSCARNVRFEAGQHLVREGDAADYLYLLREGRVALEMSVPGRGAITFQTLEGGDLVGVSWLIPPYRWTHDAKALERTRAIALDATCLRRKCEADHDLGYALMQRFVPILIERLQGARLQMLDIYGN